MPCSAASFIALSCSSATRYNAVSSTGMSLPIRDRFSHSDSLLSSSDSMRVCTALVFFQLTAKSFQVKPFSKKYCLIAAWYCTSMSVNCARIALRDDDMLLPALLRKGSDNHLEANSGSILDADLNQFQAKDFPSALVGPSLVTALPTGWTAVCTSAIAPTRDSVLWAIWAGLSTDMPTWRT